MNLLSFNLPLVVLLPFLAAPFAAWVNRYHRLAPGWLAGIITLISLTLLWPPTEAIFASQTLVQSW